MMDFQTKQQLRETFVGKFKEANAAIVAEYRGLKMEELNVLRDELRKCDAEFTVIKNRVVKKALEDVEEAAVISDDLTGPSGIVFLKGDSAAGTKAAMNFQKDNPNFVVKVGLFDGQRLEPAELKAVADLPSKEVLLAQIVGSLVSPHRGLLGVLSGVPRQLVQVINAIKETKS